MPEGIPNLVLLVGMVNTATVCPFLIRPLYNTVVGGILDTPTTFTHDTEK